jgi:hypothetical protein
MTLFWLPRSAVLAVPPKSYDSRARLRRQDVFSFAPAVGVTQTKEQTMTTRTTANNASLNTKRARKLLELQVREYIQRNRLDLGDVSIEIGPGNTVAKVRRKSREKSR